MKKIGWEAPQNTATQTIFSAIGLTIRGSCDSTSHATIDATGPAAGNGELRIQGNIDGNPFYKNVYDFGQASTESLINTDVTKTEGSGQLVYATSDGHILTFDYGWDYGILGFGAYDNNLVGCTLFGEAVYS